MHIAVAILTFSDVRVTGSRCLGVDAMIVGGLLIVVTGRALRHDRCGIVGEGLDVAVAIGTAEGAVDGRLKGCVIDMQADLFAIFVLGQSCVIVTGQALLVAHLGSGLGLRRRCGKYSEQQKKC